MMQAVKTIRAINLPSSQENKETGILSALLTKLISGAIHRKDFMAGVIEWSYEHAFLKGYFNPELPPIKSLEIRQFEKMSVREKASMSDETKDIMRNKRLEYLDALGSVKNENKSNYEWLLKMCSYYEDIGKKEVLDEIMKRKTAFKEVL